MKYTDALKLHNEDEVTVKETGYVMSVIETDIDRKYRNVNIMLEDGNWYHHSEIS